MNPIPAELIPLASALTKLLPVKPVYLVRQPDTIVLWSCTGGQPYKNVITAAEGEWVGPNRIIYRGVKVGRALELLVDPRDPLLVGLLADMLRVSRRLKAPTFPVPRLHQWVVDVGIDRFFGGSPVGALLAALDAEVL